MSLRDLFFEVGFRGDARPIQSMDRAVSNLSQSATSSVMNVNGLSSATDILRRRSDTAGRGVSDSWRRISNGISAGVTRAGAGITQLSNKMKNLSKEMNSMGRSMITKVTLPVVGLGTAATHSVARFDDGIRKVQAISGVSGEALKAIRDQAKFLGQTKRYTAVDATEAMSFLAMAGWKANQILEATPRVLQMASATGTDLATSADILSDTMTAFGISADDAGRAVDVFAKTTTSTNTTVLELGEAMKYAGSTASSVGMDLEQTSSILGILAEGGTKGSAAGTTFTAMLRDLTANAEDGKIAVGDYSIALYDQFGNMNDLGVVMAGVEHATRDMNTQQRRAALGAIFQEQAIRGVNLMLGQGSEKYFDLEQSMYNASGTAGRMSEIMEGGVGGGIRGLLSSISAVTLSFGEIFTPQIESATKHLTALADKINGLTDTQKEWIGYVLLGAGAVGIALVGMAGLISAVTFVMPAIVLLGKIFVAVFAGIKIAVVTLATIFGLSVGWIVALIAGVIVAGLLLWKYWDEIWGGMKNIFTSIDWKQLGIDAIKGLIAGLKYLNPVTAVREVASKIAGGFKDFFGINSPSRLMMEYGVNLTEGLEKGMSQDSADYSTRPTVSGGNNTSTFSPTVNITVQGDSASGNSIVKELEREFDALMRRYERKLELRNPTISIG